MILRIISVLIVLAFPAILLGEDPGKIVYQFKADIPDSIKGIQIQFEVKEVKVRYQGKMVDVFCLCAAITNQNYEPERIRVRFQCQGKTMEKEVEIGKCQQRILLIHKSMNAEESPPALEDFYSLVQLEYRQ